MIQNLSAAEVDKVIYGTDNRLDIYQSTNSKYKVWAKSTAAMILDSSLSINGDTVTIEGSTLIEEGVCGDEKFSKQKTSAMCTGFLVGEDLLLTAGHCIKSMVDCDSYSWVFGFSNPEHEQTQYSVDKNEVFKCVKIINRALDNGSYNDFALVQLDRKTAKKALSIRHSGKIANKTKLVVIGHPSGLPTKIADGAYVRSSKSKEYFEANLDTFGGNSGSPVFNVNTSVVEGILVRGEEDYIFDQTANCYRPKVCKMTDCRGEDVTRITNILELQK